MYDVRLRLMDDTGRNRGRMLAPLEFTATMTDSGASTLSMSFSEWDAGRLDTPFVVSVVQSSGMEHTPVRGGLFIVDELDTDDADPTKAVKFTGVEYVPWLLSMLKLEWSSSAKNGTRTWLQGGNESSAGYLMAGLINEGKAREWGAQVSMGFTGAVDSNGAAWTAAEKQAEPWPLLKPVMEILTQITENGLCDWWCDGTTLQLVRPGSGPLRNSVVLGGPSFTARPVKRSFKNVFTDLIVVPELRTNWIRLHNAAATSRFGRLEASMTQSGVGKEATAIRLAQPMLAEGRATKSEISFDWIPDAGGPVPFEAFNIGDTVWTASRTGKTLQRVVGLQISRTGTDPVKVRAITGDRILSGAARQARKVNSVSIGGGTTGGTGTALPTSPGALRPAPAAPTGVHVVANTAEWTSTGSVASVTIGWDPVTQAGDGSEIDVEAYEVSARLASKSPAVVATTDALSWTSVGWAAGVQRLVKVRAVSAGGKKSEWSTEIAVTPARAGVPVAPAGLRIVSNTGEWRPDGSAQSNVTIGWDEVTLDTNGALVIPTRYDVQSTVAGVTATDGSAVGLTFTTSAWAPGRSRAVRVRARAGNAIGDWSAPLTVLPVEPSSIVPKPPAGVQVTGNVGTFQDDGTAIAQVTIEWEPVTASIDDEPVQIAEYEVRADLTAWRVSAPLARLDIPSGASRDITVRALSSLAVWGDPSAPVSVTGAVPPADLAAPTVPVLTTGLGVVNARWDGQLVTGPPPAGFGFVFVETAATVAGPWYRTGTPLTGAGGTGIKSTVGAEVAVRLRTVDTLGRDGATSEPATITVTGVSGPDIEFDSITGNHIVAGTIEVNHVSPSFGDDLNISANGSVTIIVGRQDEQGAELAAVADGVSTVQGIATDAAAAAGDAQASADGAQETADAAQAAASDVGARLDQHQTYYRFTSQYLAIGDPDSSSELRLGAERIEMTQNGVTVSYWEGGVFVADEARLKRVQVGAHRWEQYGTGRTVARPL